MAAAAANTRDSSDEQYCDDWDNYKASIRDLESEDMDLTSDYEDEEEITLARLRDRLRELGDNEWSDDCDSSNQPDPQCSTRNGVSTAWQNVLKPPPLPPYSPTNVPGARVSLENVKGPVDFFQLFLSDSTIGRLIDETRHNATAKKAKLHRSTR